MEIKKLTSNVIKILLLKKYRYSKGMYSATEVNVHGGIADILCVSKGKAKSIEIEIKTSIADLQKDFIKKKRKHLGMEDCNKFSNYKPNYFYFCVPLPLLDKTIKVLEDKNKRYGIITINNRGKIVVHKEALPITHKNNEELFRRIVLRATSELVILHDKIHCMCTGE